MLRKILLVLVVVIIISQFIRPPHNAGEAAAPTDITHTVTVPDSVMAILKVSCFDCHSNHTEYPWYNNITPVNWWLYNHVQGGKRGLNFSTFNSYSFKKKAKRMDDIAETVEKHEMPLDSYLWIHKNAKLSPGQQKIIMDWAKNAHEKIMQDSIRSVMKVAPVQ